ncbi:DUF2953 domain-containing protein [Alkaliphilus crotonatoxidans]
MNGIYIGIGLTALLVIIVFSNLKIEIIALKEDQREELAFVVYALHDLVKYRFELPFVELLQNKSVFNSLNINSDIKLGQQQVVQGQKKDDVTYGELKKLYHNGSRLYKKYRTSIGYIHRHIVVKKIHWSTVVGLNDAAVTAILTGILWMIKSNILSLLNQKYATNDMKINVAPYYGGYLFQTSLNCIITLKVGHIIIAGFKMIIKKLKGW